MGEGFRGASVSLQLPCSPKPPALRPPCRAQIENFESGTPAGVCSLHGWTGTVRYVGGWPGFWRQGQSGHCDTDGGGAGGGCQLTLCLLGAIGVGRGMLGDQIQRCMDATLKSTPGPARWKDCTWSLREAAPVHLQARWA